MEDSEKGTLPGLANGRDADGSRATNGLGRYSGSLSDYVVPKFERLCRAAGFESEAESCANLLADLMEPWGSKMHGLDPNWMSEISDDNTPVEFSVTLGDGNEEVRALLEAQSTQPTLSAHRTAALELTDRLEHTYGADLSRFRKVQDLFLPEEMHGPFALWHSVVFRRGSAPSFKAYLNPAAQGPSRAPQLVEEALHRLGLHHAWSALCQSAATRGPFLDEVKYFALDLSATPEARVKIYVRHHEATPADLEATCRAADSYQAGEAYSFVRAMAGGELPLLQRAPFTCSSFIGKRDSRPVATTLYVPVCAYASNDSTVRDRVASHLRRSSPLARRYEELLEGFADRPLDAGVGLQSWAAHRRYKGAGRYTVYLATEASRVFAPNEVPAPTIERTRFHSARQAVQTALDYRLSDHPFFRRVEHRKEDLISPCRAILEDLGHALGEFNAPESTESTERMLNWDNRLGKSLISQFIARAGITHPSSLVKLDPSAAGRRLEATLKDHLMAAESQRLGAALVMRVAALQIVEALAIVMNFDEEESPKPVDEELDRHVGDIDRGLAQIDALGDDAIDGAREGALGAHRALWSWLDDLYVEILREPSSQLASGTHPVHPEIKEKGASNA